MLAASATIMTFGLESCVWPTTLETEPGGDNTEPRIDRSRTEPMFSYDLILPSEGEHPPELPMKLAVWEPDTNDVVKLRVFIDYDPNNPSPHIFERNITKDDALASDPSVRIVMLDQITPCTSDTTPGRIRMVDLVIASGWDSTLVSPEYRASLTGHTDEIRIKVTCLAP